MTPNRFLALVCGLIAPVVATAAPKPFPVGIVNLSTNEITPINTIDNLAKRPWSNPNIDGLRVKTLWSYAEPQPAQFDWTGLDQALLSASQHGKFIGLSVAAGINTPAWVYGDGATRYRLLDGSGCSMPVPWDSHFQTEWLAFVRALGQRYDGNPTLAYVVMSGFGQAIEVSLAKTSADNAALTAMGGPTAWIAASKQIITAYAGAFPTTPFFLTMAKPFPNTNPGTVSLQQVVDWAATTYPGRFGLMHASLSTRSSAQYYPNRAITQYCAVQPTGFQMVWSVFQDHGMRVGGTLDQALANGLGIGGRFVEVYEPDVEDPAQQNVLAKYHAAYAVRWPSSP